MGRVDARTLRRRRFFGLCVLAAFLSGGFVLNGWTVTPIWTLFDTNEGTFVAGDPFGDWIYAECDGEQQRITVSRNGRLEGAAALPSLRTVRFPDWCDLPTVDNPELPAWRAKLDRLQALTRTPQASGVEVLNLAREMPTSYLYLKPISDWIAADGANAAAFLDAVAARPMRFEHPDHGVVMARRQAFSGLIDDALARAAAQDVAPERLERWLAERQIAGDGRKLQKLAALGDAGSGTSALVLKRLDDVPGRERAELYATLAPRLVHDSRHAAMLAEQLRLLPHHTRAATARRLLLQPDVSVEFPIALLAVYRNTFGHGLPEAQLDLFMALASKLHGEAEAPLLLASRLQDIPDMQRRRAANHLLTLDAPGESAFALAVLRAFGDLHPLSRPKLLETVMAAPQFRDRAVQEAALLAVRLETRGHERDELLSAMLRHRDLAEDLHARIRAELG